MIPLSLFDYPLDDNDLEPTQPAAMEPDWVSWSLPFSPTLDPEYLFGQLGDYLD